MSMVPYSVRRIWDTLRLPLLPGMYCTVHIVPTLSSAALPPCRYRHNQKDHILESLKDAMFQIAAEKQDLSDTSSAALLKHDSY